MTLTEEKQKIVVLVDTSCSMLNHSASSLIVDLIKKLKDFATFDPNGIKFKTLSNSKLTFSGAVSNWYLYSHLTSWHSSAKRENFFM